MENKQLRKEKGLAGLDLIINIVAILFVCGVLVMAFVIAGSRLQSAAQDFTVVSLTENITTDTAVTEAGAYPRGLSGSFQSCTLSITVAYITNATASYEIAVGNYTTSDCLFVYQGVSDYNNTRYNLSGSYTYDRFDAGSVINQTTYSLASVVDWFPTFIVIGCIIVLMLLIIIVYRTVKGSGMTGGA